MALRAAIIGTGNIGTDLLHKSRKSAAIKVNYFVGRRVDSPGILAARHLGVATRVGGFPDLLEVIDEVDVVLDATSAADHMAHHEELKNRGKLVINLTPAKVGTFYVPRITNLKFTGDYLNLNMVTCGGQTAIPLIHKFVNSPRIRSKISSVELVSTLASKSAGPATRRNIDDYIDNTSRGISELTGVRSKVLLVINPAKPEPLMRSSVFLKFDSTLPNGGVVREIIRETNKEVRGYCAGYEVAENFISLGGKILKFSIQVESKSELFPRFAGNLDIINTAAIEAIETFVRHQE